MSISSDAVVRDFDHSNPFEVIKVLNGVVSEQRRQIQEYELAFDSILKEKEILLADKKKLEALIE